MIEDMDPEILLIDGFADCFMGICTRMGQEDIALYDKAKMLDKLVSQDMTYEEAQEFFEFNIIGAWVGDRTPAFFEKPDLGLYRSDPK